MAADRIYSADSVEALASALVTLPDPTVLSKHQPWTAFAAVAKKSLAPRLSEILRLKIEEWDSAEELAHKEAAVDLVRCLRLESCYPEMIAVASDARMCEVLLFAVAEIGTALEPHLTAALSHDDGNVRKFACRAMAAVSFESAAKAVALVRSGARGCSRTLSAVAAARPASA